MNDIISQLDSLCQGKQNNISILSNVSAFLNDCLDDINWVGFYLFDNTELILGPFQGKIACTNIAIGKGVCGTSFEKRELLNIKNVHEFPGHIACDSRSNSEIVIPLIKNDYCFGVLDIDSTSLSRFTKEDEIFLQEVVNVICGYLKKEEITFFLNL